MTGSSNDLPGSVKTSTRSVITTGPLAAMLMTRKSMPSMPGGARAQDRSDRVGDVLPAGDRLQRDVVIDGVLGEECGQLGCCHVVGPRGAKPAHHLDRAFHLAPPALRRIGYPPQTMFDRHLSPTSRWPDGPTSEELAQLICPPQPSAVLPRPGFA